MKNPKKILVAGATGYLGRHIVQELHKHNDYEVRALVRNPKKVEHIKPYIDEEFVGEITMPKTIKGICQEVDIVISTIGITKQKDGLTYEDVDYQANLNLLREAIRSGVKKFVYVSVFNGDSMRELKGVAAKLKFVEELKKADINHLIINPNGFFSDMGEFYEMAKKGRVYLFGNGECKINPIHGEDLAHVIVGTMEKNVFEIDVGGPEVLTHNQIAELAFEVANKPKKISYIPIWIKNTTLWLLRKFTSVKTYGPLEFFMTVLTRDMIAGKYGKRTLEEYFKSLE